MEDVLEAESQQDLEEYLMKAKYEDQQADFDHEMATDTQAQ